MDDSHKHHQHGSMDASDSMGMAMQMTFVNSKHVTLLFSGLKSTGSVSYAFICIGMIIGGFISMVLKVLRLRVEILISRYQWKARKLVARALLALLSVVWDFGIMLCVMSFNCGVFLSACVGITLGVAILGDQLYEAKTCRCKYDKDPAAAINAGNEDQTVPIASTENSMKTTATNVFNDPLNCCHDL